MIVLDKTGEVWDGILDNLLTTQSFIIALRGAGSVSGMNQDELDKLISEKFIPMLDERLNIGKVTIMYDGDDDDPENPDIGHVMGMLRDHFGGRINFYAAQKLGWYAYASDLPELRPLHSASGREYDTILFPDDAFEGDHNFFTQHKRLVAFDGYEQWYIGACGTIAEQQLCDLASVAFDQSSNPKVFVFRMQVSEKKTAELNEKLKTASEEWVVKALSMRKKNPFGLLFDQTGDFQSRPGHMLLEITVL